MKPLLKNILFFISVSVFSSCTTTIYIVRHAEKADNSTNAVLSDAGHQRAIALCDTLKTKGIDSIFASTFTRTQQTANPTARFLHKTISIYQPDTVAGLVRALQRISGKDILLVGHSDNVPEIIQGMTGETVTITNNDFDNLFVVKFKSNNPSAGTLVRKTYGQPTQ